MTQELIQEGEALVQRVTQIAVVDAPTFVQAGETLKTIKLYLRKVAEIFDPIVETAHQAHKTAVAQRKGVEQYAITAERTLKERMGAYEAEQARLRQEALLAAARERERLEAEERARVAAEELKRRREAEDRRLAEALAAEQAGDAAQAQALLDTPVVVEPVQAQPVFVAPPPMDTPTVEGVSFREDWDFEIISLPWLPREYLLPDEVKIRKVVKAMKGHTQIPGVRVFARRVTAVRA